MENEVPSPDEISFNRRRKWFGLFGAKSKTLRLLQSHGCVSFGQDVEGEYITVGSNRGETFRGYVREIQRSWGKALVLDGDKAIVFERETESDKSLGYLCAGAIKEILGPSYQGQDGLREKATTTFSATGISEIARTTFLCEGQPKGWQEAFYISDKATGNVATGRFTRATETAPIESEILDATVVSGGRDDFLKYNKLVLRHVIQRYNVISRKYPERRATLG